MADVRLSAALIRRFKVQARPHRFQLKQEAHEVAVALVRVFAKDVAAQSQTLAHSAGRVTFNLADVAAAVHAVLMQRRMPATAMLGRVLGLPPTVDPLAAAQTPTMQFPALFVQRGRTGQSYINHLSTLRAQTVGAMLRTNRRALRVAEAVLLRASDEYALELLAAAGRAAIWQQQRRIHPEHIRIGAEADASEPRAAPETLVPPPAVLPAV